MTSIRPSELPETSLLQKCRREGAYADCYVVEVTGSVSQSTFVEAFYTSPLFKIERGILRWFASRPSSDIEAKHLAEGTTESFAAWRVEGRTADQLLLADFTGRTKSWLMVAPVEESGSGPQTRLYFGSAVIRQPRAVSGKPAMGSAFRALLGLHRLYSKLLLGAARSRVLSAQRASASWSEHLR